VLKGGRFWFKGARILEDWLAGIREEGLMTVTYNLGRIRTLLTEGFTAEELRRFCYDEPDFRPVCEQLSEKTGKAILIDRLLEHAEQKILIEHLLCWTRKYNPARYEKYCPYDDSYIVNPPRLSSASDGSEKFQKKSSQSSLEIEPPYGTMPPESNFYVERTADSDCWDYIHKTHAVTLFIQAPRQMGKSSLMRRILYRAETELGKPCAFIDFQKIPKQHFNDEESFLTEFCLMVSEALKIPETIDQYWQGKRTHIRKCSQYLAEYIIPRVGASFILAIDEIERIVSSPFRANFFGMLRTWHNDRAYDPNFAKMTLFLSSYIQHYLLIDNPYQSPFNVAELISLKDFNLAEVEDLNYRHHSPLKPEEVNSLVELVGGHPFLIRLALYQLAEQKVDMETLLAQATEDNGPFGTHLHLYLLRISETPKLKEALRCVFRDNCYEDDQTLDQLEGLGLIKRSGRQVMLRNNLYARYFQDRFNV
jgi:hypothetical protein